MKKFLIYLVVSMIIGYLGLVFTYCSFNPVDFNPNVKVIFYIIVVIAAVVCRLIHYFEND